MRAMATRIGDDVKPLPGIGRFVPPRHPLVDVFPGQIRNGWRSNPNAELIDRLKVLCACGPNPTDSAAAFDVKCLRARKAAWEAYLFTAFACGMFEGERGNDLRARLRGRVADDFRSAMAECESCWFLAGRMKLPLDARAPGRGRKTLDMRVVLDACSIGVEVKAPFREMPQSQVWYGDDADKVEQAMEGANKQFAATQPNLLIVVPVLRHRLCSNRRDLLRAAYGETKLTWRVNVRTGEGGPVEVKFFPQGKFLNTRVKGGRVLKPDGLPGYRRISAILVIEDTLAETYPFPNPLDLLPEQTRAEISPIWERRRDLHASEDNEVRVHHEVLVLHNPYAYHALPYEMFLDFPQLVRKGDGLEWTDGQEVLV